MKYPIIIILLAVACLSGKPASHYPTFDNYISDKPADADSSLPFTLPPVKRSVVRGRYSISGAKDINDLISLFALNHGLGTAAALQGVAGHSRKGRPIEAYYFPGTSGKRAMVIAGVHGSELSSIEVARALLDQLRKSGPLYYSVLVIPALFPDNMSAAIDQPAEIGSLNNIGRYSTTGSIDPNRQMPSLGKPFDPEHPVDHLGREIEDENRLLLECITRFNPDRIVNIHAIRNVARAGIYADPRTDHHGYALGYETDSSLAIEMAKCIASGGGVVPGNRLDSMPTALYAFDPPAVLKGQVQKRNLSGSGLPGNRGHGVSLGGWASTAVYDGMRKDRNRPAIRLITMEFPGNKRPADYADSVLQAECRRQVVLYASAIREIFLAGYYTGEDGYMAIQR